MRKDSAADQCDAVEDALRRMGVSPLPVPGANRTAICITGNKEPVDQALLSRLPGVMECIAVTRPYKMVSLEVHPEPTIVQVGDVKIGNSDPVVIAGPCSVETEARTLVVQLERREPSTPGDVALVYAALGDKDRAFEWLEAAFEERDWWMPMLTVEPLFDPLRDDPRFEDLVKRVGIAP